MTKVKDILYNISNIKQVEFLMHELDAEDFNPENLVVSYATKFSTDKLNDEIFSIGLRIKYFYTLDEKDIEILKYTTEISFIVEDLKKYIKPTDADDDLFDFDNNLLIKLLGMTFSTVRGMLSVKIENSYLKKYFFPLVDVEKYLELLEVK